MFGSKFIIITREKDDEKLNRIRKECAKFLPPNINPLFFEIDSDISISDTNLDNIKLVFCNGDIYLHDKTKWPTVVSSGDLALILSYRELYRNLVNDPISSVYIIIEDNIFSNIEDGGKYYTDFTSSLPYHQNYDIAFLDVPLTVDESIACTKILNDKYYTHYLKFGLIESCCGHLITKRGAMKFLSHFNNWLYASHDQHLRVACVSGIFVDILIPTLSITSKNVQIKNKIEEGQMYVKNYESNFTIHPKRIIAERTFQKHPANNSKNNRIEIFQISTSDDNKLLKILDLPTQKVRAYDISSIPYIVTHAHIQNIPKLEIARVCSHILAQKQAIASSEADWFLILEDDIVIHERKGLENLFDILFSRPLDADCLQLLCTNSKIQQDLVFQRINGIIWLPINSIQMFGGTGAYLISRYAAINNIRLYIQKNTINLSFNEFISAESVAYANLKAYSHTAPIFLNKRSLQSPHATDDYYCNFIVNEHINRIDSGEKVYIFIIAVDIISSRTNELINMLNRQPYQKILIESYPSLPWEISEVIIDNKIEQLSKIKYPRIGDVGNYYLPYVPLLIDKIKNLKILFVDCEKEKCIDYYISSTPMQNFWSTNNTYVKTRSDLNYPKYENLTKTDAISKYWCDCKDLAELFEMKYPNVFKIFNSETILSDMTTLYDFLESPFI